MSLLSKTTLFYLLVALTVFGVGGIVTYQMVKIEVAKETDYYLRETLDRITHSIEIGKPAKAFVNDNVTICFLEDKNWTDTSNVYSDTLGKHPVLDRLEPYRKLTAIKKINDQYYLITLMDVLIESDDMYEGVVDILSQLFLYLALALIVFSFLFSRLLMAPFQETLGRIRQFNVKSEAVLSFPKTSTKEFKLLNSFLEKMTVKARKDYVALKEFNENASHEMQTPIAVASGKLEILMESPNLTQEQMGLIQSAYEAIGRLSKIGQSLTLLSKIENQEFVSNEKTNFSKLIGNNIHLFKELASLKEIDIQNDISADVNISIQPALGDILISNLLKNAIQHNNSGGWIKVKLTEKQLEVSNTGVAPKLRTEELFNRFKKGNNKAGSLGLGLAIVKKICDVSDWEIDYQFAEGVHRIVIVFEPVSKHET